MWGSISGDLYTVINIETEEESIGSLIGGVTWIDDNFKTVFALHAIIGLSISSNSNWFVFRSLESVMQARSVMMSLQSIDLWLHLKIKNCFWSFACICFCINHLLKGMESILSVFRQSFVIPVMFASNKRCSTF